MRGLGRVLVVVLMLSALVVAVPAAADTGEMPTRDDEILPYYDIRDGFDVSVPPNRVQQAALENKPRFDVRWNLRQGVPKSIINYGNYLTAPSDSSAGEVALGFLRSNAALFRLTPSDLAQLEVKRRYDTPGAGLTHVLVGQTDSGRRVFDSNLTFHVDERGRLVLMGGLIYPAASAALLPALSQSEGISDATALLGGEVIVSPGEDAAELVTFPMPFGHPSRLGWLTYVWTSPSVRYEVVTDAHTGELLYRRSQTQSEAEGNVYTVQHPLLGSQQVVPFSGMGRAWVDDRTTLGNNSYAFHDPTGDGVADYSPETPASGDPDYQRFIYTYTDAINTSGGTDYTTDRDAVITQAFYYTNMLHDRLYGYGFDEASGNFQNDNFGLGGSAGDRVNVLVDFSADTGICCNARMVTPADGGSPRLELRIGRPPDNNNMHRAMNGDTVTHEWGHGLSSRLVGMGNLGGGTQPDALGEGWSDALAFGIWGDPVYGEYNNGNTAQGIRRTAYDTSTHTFSTFCNGCSGFPHPDGEVWATALWDVRDVFTTKYGATEGADRFLFTLVDGMKLTPATPTYLDARDGVLAANQSRYSETEHCSLWAAFALNGMGFSATGPTDEAFDVAPECMPTADAGGPYNVLEGGSVDLSATGSSMASHASAGGNSFLWDLDGDGEYDDASGPSPTFDDTGQDAIKTVGLQVVTQAGATDTATSTLTIENVAPSVSLGTNAPKDEGSSVSVNGAITDPGWDDPLTGTIDWGDGSVEPIAGTFVGGSPPKASLTFDLTHAYGDNGTYPVKVCAQDDDIENCQSIDVLINNVAPDLTLDAAQIDAILEGDVLNAFARFTDPGWLDTYTYEVDWGVGAPDAGVPVIDVDGPPQDEGHIAGTHQFGDNGSFDVEISISDDDAGTDDVTFELQVDNVDPTAAIDRSGAIDVNGNPTFISRVLLPVPYAAESDDPGSDDLTFVWDWDDGAPAPDEQFKSRVAPPADDPLPSADVNPRIDVIDSRSHSFSDACLYVVDLGLTDDDAGTAADEITTIIQAAQGGKKQPSSYWQSELKRGGKVHSAETLNCYLDISGYMSRAFNEERDASTISAGFDVVNVSGSGGSPREKLDRELLTSWLNFANGAFDYLQFVDTNGDHLPDTRYADAMTAAEDVRLNPAATGSELDQQRLIIHTINK